MQPLSPGGVKGRQTLKLNPRTKICRARRGIKTVRGFRPGREKNRFPAEFTAGNANLPSAYRKPTEQ